MSDKPTYMKHMPHFLGPVAPITIDHAEGSWVYDTDGGKWLDFVVGIAVEVGHATDYPDIDKRTNGDIKIGDGPTVSRGPNINPRLEQLMVKTAKAKRA